MPTDYAIKDGRTVFDATTYTGNGATSRSITNAGQFQPDFVWLKERDVSLGHALYDIVRGVGSGTKLSSDSTGGEGGNDNATYGYVSSIDSNGFSVARGSDGSISYTNKNNGTYVAWQWKANGTAVSNTSGTITSSVSANTTAGFSIVTYTGTGAGATIGHGLGVAPSFYIVKNRTDAGTNWYAYHSTTGAGNYLVLNTTDPSSASVNVWNNTSPTSSVFSVGASASNTSGKNYVAYCWAEIAGFSKFGSYTGNSSTDGPFVYTGFRPKYILIKSTSAGYDWAIYDSATGSYNVISNNNWANLSNAEYSNTASTGLLIDFLSNGFKIRGTNTEVNNSGLTYIYAAFAENPFKYANAR